MFELVKPLAGFEELANDLIATDEDAASSIGGGVAHVDADAFEEVVEVGTTEQQRQPHLELRTPRDDYRITAFWDGKGLQFLSLRW